MILYLFMLTMSWGHETPLLYMEVGTGCEPSLVGYPYHFFQIYSDGCIFEYENHPREHMSRCVSSKKIPLSKLAKLEKMLKRSRKKSEPIIEEANFRLYLDNSRSQLSYGTLYRVFLNDQPNDIAFDVFISQLPRNLKRFIRNLSKKEAPTTTCQNHDPDQIHIDASKISIMLIELQE